MLTIWLHRTTRLHPHFSRVIPTYGPLLPPAGCDNVVDSHSVADYLAEYRPQVRTHLIEEWTHGAGVTSPWNWPTVLPILEDFFCSTSVVEDRV